MTAEYVETLSPGLYAFWRGRADAKLVEIDTRETMVDVSGQEMMTGDKKELMNKITERRVERRGGLLRGERRPICGRG